MLFWITFILSNTNKWQLEDGLEFISYAFNVLFIAD